MKKITRLLPALPFMPALVFAQGGFAEASTFLKDIVGLINDTLVPFIFAIAFIVFIWGVFQYFIQGGADEGKRDEGKQHMLWGIIGFVLMVSVWGIVNLIAGGLGLNSGANETLKDLHTVQLNNP